MTNDFIKLIHPADRWEEALPLGNGMLGALVHGDICTEKITFNHEALWFRYPKKDPPFIGDSLKELREIMEEGEFTMMDSFLNINLNEKGYNAQTGFDKKKDRYHPLCDLIMTREPLSPFKDYFRTLKFDEGVAYVKWEENNAQYSRECFMSRTSNTFFLKYGASSEFSNDGLSCNISLKMTSFAEENAHYSRPRVKREDIAFKDFVLVNPPYIEFGGEYMDEKLFGAIACIYTVPLDSMEVVIIPEARSIKVENAKEIYVCVKYYANIEDNDIELTVRTLKDQLNNFSKENSGNFNRTYNHYKENHILSHGELYTRVELDYSTEVESKPDASNEQLMMESYGGTISPTLVKRMFNFGRYLLISSSRKGGWPANLQGVWNAEYWPAWESDYHNDENIQMNYWPALPGNLEETTLPYFELYEACLEDYRKNARAIYDCRGILAPIAQTTKGNAPLYGGPWLNWTSGAGWLAQLFYDYWLFTGDKEFLKTRAIPFLKEVAEFYEDFLIINKDTGKYMFCPSLSPENVPIDARNGKSIGSLATINATMDVAVSKEIFSNLLEGCSIVGVEQDNLPKWEKILENLPDYEINEDGAIKEWIHPLLKDNYQHRHMSHVYPIFPGFEVTRENSPELFNACKVAVDKRQVVGQQSQSGWSWAHMANVYARLENGKDALQCLHNLIRSCVLPNLFTLHNDWRKQGLTLNWDFKDKIFQIDANFGITAAIIEMLVYSNRKMIKILPALPQSWKKGHIHGIKTRCQLKVSVDWELETQNEINLTLISKDVVSSEQILLAFPREISEIDATDEVMEQISESDLGKNYKLLEIKPNQTVKLSVIIR